MLIDHAFLYIRTKEPTDTVSAVGNAQGTVSAVDGEGASSDQISGIEHTIDALGDVSLFEKVEGLGSLYHFSSVTGSVTIFVVCILYGVGVCRHTTLGKVQGRIWGKTLMMVRRRTVLR